MFLSKKPVLALVVGLCIFSLLVLWKQAQLASIVEDENLKGPPELQPLRPESLQILFGKIDKDKNGRFTLTDVTRYARGVARVFSEETSKEIFESLDVNHDGLVNWAESHPTEDVLDLQGESGTPLSPEIDKELFKVADADNDQALTLQEYFDYSKPTFCDKTLAVLGKKTMTAMDLNTDGMVSHDELASAYKRYEEDGFDFFIGSASMQEEAYDISLSQVIEAGVDHVFKLLDANHNSLVDSVEILVLLNLTIPEMLKFQPLFEKYDVDKDGELVVDQVVGIGPDIFESELHWNMQSLMYRDEIPFET